jgi:hypothetical protein
MISFELRFNEATGHWQAKGGEAPWSEPLTFAKLTQWLRQEVAPPVPVEDWGKRRDNMPVVHVPKGQGPTATQDLAKLSEIYTRPDGTKAVRRIPATTQEKRAQELNELLALLEVEE